VRLYIIGKVVRVKVDVVELEKYGGKVSQLVGLPSPCSSRHPISSVGLLFNSASQTRSRLLALKGTNGRGRRRPRGWSFSSSPLPRPPNQFRPPRSNQDLERETTTTTAIVLTRSSVGYQQHSTKNSAFGDI